MACAICDEKFEVARVNCKAHHLICKSCINTWMQYPLNTQVTCPVCDEDITMHGKRVIWVPTLDNPCSTCGVHEAEVFVDCKQCHRFCVNCIKPVLDEDDYADCPVCDDIITEYTYIEDIGHCNTSVC